MIRDLDYLLLSLLRPGSDRILHPAPIIYCNNAETTIVDLREKQRGIPGYLYRKEPATNS